MEINKEITDELVLIIGKKYVDKLKSSISEHIQNIDAEYLLDDLELIEPINQVLKDIILNDNVVRRILTEKLIAILKDI